MPTNPATHTLPPQASMHNRRAIGLVPLTFLGITSIVGSGWLFGAFHAAQVAGPAAIFAWIIGAFALTLVALVLAELGTLFSQSGGIARYLEYTHGSLSGFLGGWINWFALTAYLPTEAAASVQYLSSMEGLHVLMNPKTAAMSSLGLLVASGFMILYLLLNYWTLNLFIRSVTYITIFKLFVPIFSVFAIMWSSFHPSNFGDNYETFAPYGMHGVFTALSVGGIIFAFNGFQSIVNFAGEAKNPRKNIPIALVGSIVSCLILYLILQVSFIGALSPMNLQHTGWQGLDFSSPFIQLALVLNLHFAAILLYINSVVSPSGTGIVYMGSCARMLFGMQRNGYMPKSFGVLHPVYGVPRNAVMASFLLGILMLWVFKGWSNLASIISVMTALAYLSGPVSAIGLRTILPDWHSPCRIKGMPFIAPVCFMLISLIIYWAGWPLTGEALLIILCGLTIYLYYQYKNNWKDMSRHLSSGLWFICYLFSITLLSRFGDRDFGGANILHAPYDQITVLIISFIFYHWGIRRAWITPALRKFRTNNEML